MAQGIVWKRCTHDGKTRDTGKPATNKRPAIPACRCKGGSWWWRIDAGKDPVTNTRRQLIRGGYPTRAAAEEGLDDMRDQIRRGIITDDKGHTVATWLRDWLQQGERDRTWEPTTLAGYRSDVETYLVPLLGHIRMRDLQRAHVAAMLGQLAKQDDTRTQQGKRGGSTVARRSGATVDKVRRTLRSALTVAVSEGVIPVNHAAGRFRQIPRREHAEADWWQPDELAAFLEHVQDDPDVALWTVSALTGLRRSEILGLRWEDVDLTSGVPGLYVRQKCIDIPGPQQCLTCGREHKGRLLRGGAGEGRGSKSAAGVGRWVPLVQLEVVELVAHQARQEMIRGEFGDHWSEHGLVFPLQGGAKDRDLPGSPRRPDSVTKRHAELVASAGLRTIVLHEMRHGAVSILHAAGMPLDQIALIVGHSTKEVTRRIYTHSIRSALGEHAEAAARLIARASGGRPVGGL